MNDRSPTTAATETPSFDAQLEASLQALRAAVIELLVAVGADPNRPQDMARQFGLNKNLTWKVSKMVGGSDLYSAVPHIPGSAGIEIFLRALSGAGAPTALVEEARRAAREFERVVKVHTGDRSTLEIMINRKLPVSIQSEQAELNRKRAYQGNSGLWGMRARTQLSLSVLAPSADDPEKADLAQVGGLDRFRRLRPDARCLLFRRERWDDDNPHPPRDVMESIDPNFPIESGVPLIGDFCSKPIPEIELISGEGEDQYELPPGPVGNTAAFTCIHGQISRRIGDVHADAEGEYAEIGCNLISPAEHLVLDFLVHRDFEWAMEPELLVYGRLDGGPMRADARRQRNLLSLTDPVHSLGWGITALSTPLLPRYPKLLRYVFDQVGWDPDDFRALRFLLNYPPIPTVVLLRSRLPLRAPDRG